MIKFETIGAIQAVKNNPVLKSASDVANHSFITDNDILYLVSNTIVGDNAYMENQVIPAGEPLNGFDVKSLEGLKLIADEKHIAYADSKAYTDIVAGTTLMTVNSDGKLAVAASAPSAGVYFLVTEKCFLTQNAVKLLVKVV